MKISPAIRVFTLTTAFLFLLISAPITRNAVLLVAYVLLSLYVVLSRVRLFSGLRIRESAAIAIIGLSLTLMLPISVMRNATALIHFYVAMISLGCAYVLSRNIDAYLAASRISLIAAQLILLAYVASIGLADYPLENLFSHTSSNGITSALILIQVNYSTVKYLVTRRASLLTSTLTLIVCLIGFGRASILAAAAVVLVNLLFQLSWRSHWRALTTALLIASVSAAVHFAGDHDIVRLVQANTKIGAGLHDEPRERMITDYLDQIDAGTLITGASYHGTSIEAEFSGNPHNSYIRAHHIFGLPYLLSMLLLPVLLLWHREQPTLRLYSVCMLAIVLTRSFSEPLLFPTPFDFYFFAICFALGGGVGRIRHTQESRLEQVKALEGRVAS